MTTYVEQQLKGKAYEQAVMLYRTTYGRGSLLLDILHYANNHFAYFSPSCIILARVVEGNTWHIHLACGHGCLRKFFDLAPFKLDYVSYDRPLKNKTLTTKYKWDKLRHYVFRLHA